MTRFDVNASILFTGLPLLERPAAVRAAGFDGIEFWWPFAEAVPADKDVDAFVGAVQDAGVQLVGLNFADDIASGGRGLVSRPADSARFRDNVDVAIGIAGRLGCTALNALYGNRVAGLDPAEQDELAAENLAIAARAAAGIGAVVLVEALNGYESPSYPLVSAEAAVEAAGRAGEPNVMFLCDLYHLARMGEDLEAVIAGHAARIGHVQIADVPGRGRPGTGGLDFGALLSVLERHGYEGWVGLEYKDAEPDFGWSREFTRD
ncbi:MULTISPECIES: hydroxypyruvate isomerase family protein [Streptosporangium]|uniref:Hydroxypyruvate isomerase n=1 Tax=Streptosporangium brasiliense TaxID=47480 RepID=A0ABT9RFZ8_9ACTN|nr:TIM barrel protein [Streptosporangium brasiliense]MDP9868187.1 hydroxypyruvate isomerase [Streptosporangium brasiliense]